jgi:transposase
VPAQDVPVPVPSPTFVQLALPAPTVEGTSASSCSVAARRLLSCGRQRQRAIVRPGCATGCDDPHRGGVAVHRADGHACGTDTTLARVVQVFGAARPHHAYVFANRRSTRLKVLIHDCIGIWLAARRLHQGRFIWPGGGCGAAPSLTREQLEALLLGLPWQRVGEAGAITVV